MSQHVSHLLCGLGWSAMRGYLQGFGKEVGWITPVYVHVASLFVHLDNRYLQVVLGQAFQLLVPGRIVGLDAHLAGVGVAKG